MIKLAMVRHGQTDYNYTGLVQGRINNPLNENGRNQALKLGEIILSENKIYDEILSSPLSRALETAYIISKTLNKDKPIEIIQHFVERDFGALDGQDVKIARAHVRNATSKIPGFEEDDVLVGRIAHAAYNLLHTHDGKSLLCVAHSHVLKALLVYSDPKQFNFADYYLTNGDVINLEIYPDKIKFISHIHHPNGAIK